MVHMHTTELNTSQNHYIYPNQGQYQDAGKMNIWQFMRGSGWNEAELGWRGGGGGKESSCINSAW